MDRVVCPSSERGGGEQGRLSPTAEVNAGEAWTAKKQPTHPYLSYFIPSLVSPPLPSPSRHASLFFSHPTVVSILTCEFPCFCFIFKITRFGIPIDYLSYHSLLDRSHGPCLALKAGPQGPSILCSCPTPDSEMIARILFPSATRAPALCRLSFSTFASHMPVHPPTPRPTDWKSAAPSSPPGTTTFAAQSTLPKLPVLPLVPTLERLKATLVPIAHTPSELAEAHRKIDAFANGIGRELQNRLEAHALYKAHWLEEWWDDSAYLSYRDSVLSIPRYQKALALIVIIRSW